MDTIQDYMIPLIRIVVNLIAGGSILRCMCLLISSLFDGQEIHEVLPKVTKKIRAGILAVCVTELLYFVARVFGYVP